MSPSRSATDDAARALRSLILARGLKVGARVPPERELAAAMGVSRSTIREAISRLVSVGVLTARQGSGTYVAAVDFDAVFEVRLQLEPFSARLAARNRDDAHVARLLSVLRDMEGSLDEPARFGALDAEVHELVSTAAANPVLRGMLAQLAELANLSREITAGNRRVRGRSLRHLQRLARAIADADGDAAAAAMDAHLRQLRAALQGEDESPRPAREAS